MSRFIMYCIFVVTLFAHPLRATEPIVIPFLADPSPMIDGNFQEWGQRGVHRALAAREQATFAGEKWKGPSDLSGWIRFGYDETFLYVAAHVVDDFFIQDQTSTEAWRGDHIILNIDMLRSGKMQDVWQMGLSPGSLSGENPTRPELIIWEPLGASIEGAVVAARRTAEGYDIEAAIPWKIWGVTPTLHQTFALEAALSDCDTTPTMQEKLISIDTAPWKPRDPARLIPAGLADRSGHFPPDAFDPPRRLAEEIRISHGETHEITVQVDQLPPGRVPTLTFKGRVDSPRAGGCAGPLAIRINGKPITRDHIANRLPVVTFLSGGTQTTWYGAGVTLWYGPDFESIEKSSYKPLDVVSYDLTLRLDDLIQPGENIISFQHADERPQVLIVLADVALGWSSPSRFAKPKEYAPAPTGELPVIEPWTGHRVAYTVAGLPGGAIAVKWADRELVLESRLSIPGGTWAQLRADEAVNFTAEPASRIPDHEQLIYAGRCGELRLVRTIERSAEVLRVRDTLINESSEERPLIIRHSAAAADDAGLWLGGRPVPMKTGASSVSSNPSVVVLAEYSGFGLLAHDDVFRLHYRGSFDGKTATIEDDSLVLRPGVTYHHEWLIVPLPVSDYWHFANAARRYFGNNFTIPGSFTFFGLHKQDLPLLPWEIGEYLDHKNAQIVCVEFGFTHKGYFPHGPLGTQHDGSRPASVIKTIKALRPQYQTQLYFNCFDGVRAPGEPELWPECRLLLPDGRQVFNGAAYPLYFPTLDNEYGRLMDQTIDWLLHDVGADGLYWDCYAYANVDHYGEPWDGWTANIDPVTHRVTRKRSSSALISWPWREKVTARILAEGRPLVANGNPNTTSEYKYQFPRFVESADITALCGAHLYTPIALGDHITERNEVDAYRWMLRALDFGGLYYWYSGRIIPTRPTLTSYMFPFTPIELHAGYLIGEERILTNRSGLFGWGDDSRFDVFVFDRVGKLTDQIKAPRVQKEGKAYAELRLPEGYSAAIVRSQAD